MQCCRHLPLELLKSGETNPRAISLLSAIVRRKLLLEFSGLLNDPFSVIIVAGLNRSVPGMGEVRSEGDVYASHT